MSRPLRVLVVDDFPDSAETTAQLLSLHGHDARPVCSYDEAVRVVGGGFAPDVALLDLVLPDGDGCALADELCGALPARPVLVAVTGVPGQAEKCRAAGFDHLLLKPADPKELVRLLWECSVPRGEARFPLVPARRDD